MCYFSKKSQLDYFFFNQRNKISNLAAKNNNINHRAVFAPSYVSRFSELASKNKGPPTSDLEGLTTQTTNDTLSLL